MFAQAVGWTPDVVRWLHIGLIIAGMVFILFDLGGAVRSLTWR